MPYVKNFFCCGMQDHKWSPDLLYDCIWLQWFLMYLTDDDLVEQLTKCKEHLTINPETQMSGFIIIKENICERGTSRDDEDNSVIRTVQMFNDIFDKVGLMILHTSRQPGWSKDLFPVQLWVL